MLRRQTIIFTGLWILFILVTGVASTVYAISWGEVPEPCEEADKLSSTDEEDICDSVALTTTNSIQAVSA